MSYIKLSEAAAIRLNDLLYHEYVSEDGVSFKFPFQVGTTSYINTQNHETAYFLDENMTELGNKNVEVVSLIANPVTRAEAIANGWIIEILP